MNPGDRVRVRRDFGRDAFGKIERVHGAVAWVVIDGKHKPAPVPLRHVSLVASRAPSPPLALTRAPSYERPELLGGGKRDGGERAERQSSGRGNGGGSRDNSGADYPDDFGDDDIPF